MEGRKCSDAAKLLFPVDTTAELLALAPAALRTTAVTRYLTAGVTGFQPAPLPLSEPDPSPDGGASVLSAGCGQKGPLYLPETPASEESEDSDS